MLLIDYALKYVAAHLPVLPLCWPDFSGKCACGRNHQDKSIGKVPLLEHGLTDATLSITKAKEYWTRWPTANIGIAIPHGYFVLDVDVGHNGFDSLSRIQRELDFDLTPTWLVTTGSGGQHYWYKTSKHIRNTTRLAGYEGLDIRGWGGYCVVPSSLHRSGHRYEVSPVWDGDIVIAPPELIDLCLKPIDIVRHYQTPIDTTRYLEGQRNDALTRDAGAMRRRGLSEEAIYAALQVTNQERCQPALPDSDIRTISKSVSRYPPAEVRGERRAGEPKAEDKPKFKGGI